MNFHDDLKVSPYSSIAFWVRYFFSFTEILHLQSIINGKSWKHFRLKVRQITWWHPPEWRSWRKKMRTCYLFFRTLTEITLYQNLLSFSGEILQWLQKKFGKKFSLTKVSSIDGWEIQLISSPLDCRGMNNSSDQAKQISPLFWVFMFVFQVTIDQYQACQCGWFS